MKLASILLLFTVALAASDVPTKRRAGRGGEELRLPRDILPRLYEVTLLPILIEGNFTTEGSVNILVDCVQSTNNITLHIADITFNPAEVTVCKIRISYIED